MHTIKEFNEATDNFIKSLSTTKYVYHMANDLAEKITAYSPHFKISYSSLIEDEETSLKSTSITFKNENWSFGVVLDKECEANPLFSIYVYDNNSIMDRVFTNDMEDAFNTIIKYAEGKDA